MRAVDDAREWLRPLGDRQDSQTKLIRRLADEQAVIDQTAMDHGNEGDVAEFIHRLATELTDYDRRLKAAESRCVALTQERDAQFAHNRELIERFENLEKDNEFVNEYTAKLQGILDGTGNSGSITWDLGLARGIMKRLEAAEATLRSVAEEMRAYAPKGYLASVVREQIDRWADRLLTRKDS